MQLRPEYVEATDAARFNFWLWLSIATPWLLVLASTTKRKTRIYAIIFSYPVCWILFCIAVEHYWNAKLEFAMTDAEMSDATADTGRLFGPVVVGIPLVAIYVTFVSLLICAVDWIGRVIIRKLVG